MKFTYNEENIKKTLLDNFLTYVKIWTTSDSEKADAGIQPSTERQLDLAKKLLSQLNHMDIESVLTDKGYLCTRIPGNNKNIPSICFLAHMDTAGEVSGENVNPQVFENYDGKTIKLNGVSINPEENPELAKCKGNTIITSDGTTLLGADDKAGIAEIMTAISILIQSENDKLPHGQIEIIFSPDEETGHGMDNVPVSQMESKFCYTIDGGNLGEVESECFNAYKSEIYFTGKALHTGYARPNMVNAVSMASKFVSLLPQNESPEATDGYLGFYAPMEIAGGMEEAKVTVYLRDFTDKGMKRRIKAIDSFAESIKAAFPGGNVRTVHTEQYKNMKSVIDKNPQVIDNLVEAVKNAGVEPVRKPIRGGTDGSRLTEMGLPTPNVFTGGHNFHSRTEWASLDQMVSVVKTILELISIYAEKAQA